MKLEEAKAIIKAYDGLHATVSHISREWLSLTKPKFRAHGPHCESFEITTDETAVVSDMGTWVCGDRWTESVRFPVEWLELDDEQLKTTMEMEKTRLDEFKRLEEEARQRAKEEREKAERLAQYEQLQKEFGEGK